MSIAAKRLTAWIKMQLGTEVSLGPDDIVLDGDPALPSSKGDGAPSPILDPLSIVAKLLDASRFEVPLGMEVGLSPGDFVLDGDPAPPP